MYLFEIPSDIICYITSFLENKDNSMFIQTCKNIHLHGITFGYFNYIKANLSTNMLTFIHRFNLHSNTIRTVEMHYIDDPHIWLPIYVEKLIFEHCSIPSYINPGKQIHITKSIKLTDYHKYKFKTVLRINWECFPNLEELDLYVHKVELTGIQVCKKLKSIKINNVILS
jgi:hypothetical protein